jgi:hypothetical protein
VNARHALNSADAGTLAEGADYSDLLFEGKYVSHAFTVIHKRHGCQVFLCYTLSMRKIVAVVLWAWVPFFWQPLRGQAPREGVQTADHKTPKQRAQATQCPACDQRGTKEAPFVVDTKGHQNTPEETAKEQQSANWEKHIERRTLYLAFVNTLLAGLLIAIGLGGVVAALMTLNAIRRQADLQERAIRPWVGTISVARGALTDDRMIRATVVLKNTGPSVALHGLMVPFLVRGAKINQGKNGSWAEMARRLSGTNETESGFVLHPNAIHTHSVYLPLGDIQDFELENGVCYVLVCIAYRDQFDRVHQTQDCFRVMLPAKPLVAFEEVPANQIAN